MYSLEIICNNCYGKVVKNYSLEVFNALSDLNPEYRIDFVCKVCKKYNYISKHVFDFVKIRREQKIKKLLLHDEQL